MKNYRRNIFVGNDAPFYFPFILTNFLAFVRKRSLKAFSYLVKSNFAYYNGSTYFEPFECIHHHALFLWCLLFFPRTLRANYQSQSMLLGEVFMPILKTNFKWTFTFQTRINYVMLAVITYSLFFDPKIEYFFQMVKKDMLRAFGFVFFFKNALDFT